MRHDALRRMSDTLSQLGLFEYNPKFDQRGQSAHLFAHALWYFFEGVSLRFGDFPVGSKKGYEKYSVLVNEEDTLIFYKSPNSGRWWIEIPKGEAQSERFSYPCNFEDYQEALKGKFSQVVESAAKSDNSQKVLFAREFFIWRQSSVGA